MLRNFYQKNKMFGIDTHDANFFVFHIAFPYSTEVALLAKTFTNVYLDICWMSWYAYG